MPEQSGEIGQVALRCEGTKRYALRCQRMTAHPSHTCAAHRDQADHLLPVCGTDAEGEWWCYARPTRTGYTVILLGFYGRVASIRRRRYVKDIGKGLAVRDEWAANLNRSAAEFGSSEQAAS